MKIIILAFNYGYAGTVVNGPGMCLANLVKFLGQVRPDIEVNVFSKLKVSKDIWPNIHSLDDRRKLSRSIIDADIVHLWSGMSPQLIKAVQFANKLYKKVIIGPNVIDTVELNRERNFLSQIKYDTILTPNGRLSFKICKDHNETCTKLRIFQVGPDLDLWEPSSEGDGTILWKGNGRQFVKDVKFAREVEKELGGKYRFKFIGHPDPYDYFDHIEEAKKSKMVIITSLSETMGLALMESWCSGLPSVTHPKIYMHGVNYRTGIVTNRTIASYAEAIEEIMGNSILYEYLSLQCREFILNEFSAEKTVEKYLEIVGV